MRIASFNINNIRRRLPNLVAWLREAKPDVCCLQELKATDKVPAIPAYIKAAVDDATRPEADRKRDAGRKPAEVFTLAPDKTPVTVDNFLSYVNSGFYDGTVFHRVVVDFVVQGGGYLPITPGTTPILKTPLNPEIPLEVGRGLSNTQWTVAMARRAEQDTASSQFFINVVDNSAKLDPGVSAGYAVFGAMTTGMAIASSIVGAPCAPLAGFSECVPNPNIEINATQTQ